MATFFARAEPKLLPVQVDKRIEVQPFLACIRQILPFFDLLGRAFTPIKSDINGNITKLQKKLDKNPDKMATFREMLLHEIDMDSTRHKESATIALLWLKRALEFMEGFLRRIVEDHNSGKKTENMSSHCLKSYEEALKPYHGWIVQKIFSVLTGAIPWRRDFLKTLAYDQEGLEDEVVQDMGKFVEILAGYLEVIRSLYAELNLDFQDKV